MTYKGEVIFSFEFVIQNNAQKPYVKDSFH